MKATEQYFPHELYILQRNVVVTFESVDAVLKCGHSNESYRAVPSVMLFTMPKNSIVIVSSNVIFS